MSASSVTRIDQVIPTLASRDAIGRHTLQVRSLLRDLGFESDIFYANASQDVLGEGRHVEQLGDVGERGRWLLYQLSIGSPAATAFAARPEPKLVDYHNITPVELIDAWEPSVGDELRLGRSQLRQLAPLTTLAMADSEFNERELESVGFERTAVAPLLIDLDDFGGAADGKTARDLETERRRGGIDILFVGKVAPHKAQHDLVKAFSVYRRLYDPRARLHMVGGPIGDAYPWAIEQLAETLGVRDGIDMPGTVSHDQLVSYYRTADVFVCLSDHEGFCVPLVEAMVHRLPIVAYGVTAVPDTIGGAGVVLDTKEPLLVAAAIHKVTTDSVVRAALSELMEQRLRSLSLDGSRERFKAVVMSAIGEA